MNVFNFIVLISVFFSSIQHKLPSNQILKAIIHKEKSEIPYIETLKENPTTVSHDNALVTVKDSSWTSGFYPGCLWYLYELTNDTLFEKAAERRTKLLKAQQYNSSTHDMGFKMYCSYGNGYRLTKNATYKKILIQSAYTLIKRFNPKIGCIRSWNHSNKLKNWKFPVIIDNMMNLELLFWAYNQTGDSIFYKIAVSHADKTMKNHFRKDYSSYHVVDYNPKTGKVLEKCTHQGYSDQSAWARGQAWGLYGFTMVYRETGDKKYLQMAEHIANFILTNKNMPKDMVPYWDFNAPNIPDEPRDASSAAIISSALLELSTYSGNKLSGYYREKAHEILSSLLSKKYMSAPGTNYNFILLHSTGNYPAHSEIDVPIIYADYYLLEAIIRNKKLQLGDTLYIVG